jgi:hypothetical protein
LLQTPILAYTIENRSDTGLQHSWTMRRNVTPGDTWNIDTVIGNA